MTVYQIVETTFLDRFNKCYINVISINNNPCDDKLKHIIKTVPYVKLSPFEGFSPCCEVPACQHLFKNPETGKFLTLENIDFLFTELINAGYKIETELTKLLKKKNKKLICFVSK